MIEHYTNLDSKVINENTKYTEFVCFLKTQKCYLSNEYSQNKLELYSQLSHGIIFPENWDKKDVNQKIEYYDQSNPYLSNYIKSTGSILNDRRVDYFESFRFTCDSETYKQFCKNTSD